jgi:hypothetical protein
MDEVTGNVSHQACGLSASRGWTVAWLSVKIAVAVTYMPGSGPFDIRA